MEAFVSSDVLAHVPFVEGAGKSHLSVQSAGKTYSVLWVDKSCFAISAKDAPKLTGLVDLYQRKAHKGLFLVSASRLVGDEMRYDFKEIPPFAQEAAKALEDSAARPVVLVTDALSDFQ